MIEVEKKFRPTEEQLNALLKDSEFIKDVTNHDIIYDYPDYRLIKQSTRLRRRNGKFELKLSETNSVEEEASASIEIEDEEGIKKYFNISTTIEDFIKTNLIEGINIVTKRKKYKYGQFIIDVDKLDFGYECVEIELLVNNKAEIPNAYHDILELARKYNFSDKKVPPKRNEYFRIVKPEVYKKLYGDKDKNF